MPEGQINWEKVRQEAFTEIRAKFGIQELINMAFWHGNYTPVSGDRLTKIKKGIS